MAGLSITKWASLRCWLCRRSWPAEDIYEICPACRERTAGSKAMPMSPDEATRLRAEFDFGWYLWDTESM